MREPDEEVFVNSVRSTDSMRSGFYEPSISTRGSRSLQRKYRRRARWPWFIFWLLAVCGAAMLYFRFKMG